MPFLIIVCAGIIAILLLNLFRVFFEEEKPRAAYLHLVSGSVEMRTWGTENFFSLTSDVVIMEGDEIRSSADARLIVEFFDGSLMRMGGNTVVEFSSIVNEGRSPSIGLDLKRGDVWFNRLYKGTKDTDITVTSSNIRAKSNLASVFAVGNSSNAEYVRVFGVFENEGLLVDVLRKDGGRAVETERVGVGQEIVFDSKVLERYWQYQSPTVIAAISNDFKQSSWGMWNLEEDKNPTQFEKTVEGFDAFDFVRVEPEIFEGADEDFDEGEDDIFDLMDYYEDDGDEDDGDIYTDVTYVSEDLPKPSITSVAGITETDENGFYRVTSRVATLEGTVSGAHKVVVNDYVLQQFNPGDTTWRYFANADFDLMREGENIYNVYAENEDGVKSEVLTVKVFYEIPPPPPPPEEHQEDSSEEIGSEEADQESDE